jgi:iron complex transport system ATP-binding protein
LALIRRLAQHDGIAVVVTLHDLNHAALCATRVALLAHSALVAIGHPEAVLTPDCLSQVLVLLSWSRAILSWDTPSCAWVFCP